MSFEADSYYHDNVANKEVNLRAEGSKMMVTFAPPAREAVAGAIAPYRFDPAAFAATAPHGFAVAEGEGAGIAEPPIARAPQAKAWGPVYRNQDDGNLYYVVPDEIELQFREGVRPETAEEVIRARGCRVVGEPRTAGYYMVAVPAGQAFATVRALSADSTVEYAAPSLVAGDVRVATTPAGQPRPANLMQLQAATPAVPKAPPRGRAELIVRAIRKPLFAKQWALENTGQDLGNRLIGRIRGTKGADLKALDAWCMTAGSSKVVVVIIDRPVDVTHPDLETQVLPRGGQNWDFLEPSDPGDLDQHATGIAGVAVAALNGKGVVGVAPRCRFMPLAITGNGGHYQRRAEAIYHAVSQARTEDRKYVINLSWKLSCDHPGVRRAIRCALAAGLVVVAAVPDGDSGAAGPDLDLGPPPYPSSYDDVIAVAATDRLDELWFGSGFGARVDVCAPGATILTPVLQQAWDFQDGTSFAAPHVVGLAALVWSARRCLSNSEVRQIIKARCDNIDQHNPGRVGKLGSGRINAESALRLAAQRRYLLPAASLVSRSSLAPPSLPAPALHARTTGEREGSKLVT